MKFKVINDVIELPYNDDIDPKVAKLISIVVYNNAGMKIMHIIGDNITRFVTDRSSLSGVTVDYSYSDGSFTEEKYDADSNLSFGRNYKSQ